MSIHAVLFDLDGTLADTAPDLAGALNALLEERRRPLVPVDAARPVTSSGARGMLKVGFGIDPGHAEYEVLKARFLDLYAERVCVETQLFAGIAELLATLDARAVPWGVVTNKAERFTRPLLEALALLERAACVVGGDTAARAKPHPDPLLHAARRIGIEAGHCLYVGDDLRDVQSARAAGMPVLAAAYGYRGVDGDPHAWGADAVIEHPLEVLKHLSLPI
ncbi:MAG TPA: phosphoglycolate phosphatase [Burkholderiales bacterium]|jgi:phosphoglycolate phosphatase|nr:phosphoglycolate phosphatase [Burkholderiales bacterium]